MFLSFTCAVRLSNAVAFVLTTLFISFKSSALHLLMSATFELVLIATLS